MNELALVIAYVRPVRRAAVAQALRNRGGTGWTESNAVGHGRAAGGHEVDHVRFEVLCSPAQAEELSALMAQTAQTNTPGDGLVLILPVASAVRVSDLSSWVSPLHIERTDP